MSPTLRYPLFLLWACLLNTACAEGQDSPAPDYPTFPQSDVEAAMPDYQAASLTTRRFKPADIQQLIGGLDGSFTVDTAGRSVEGRPIFRIAWGTGPVEVLLWSQMHGDEPTATAALFDLFNFLSGSGDGLDSLRDIIGSRLHLTFLPMLNPDGAQRYQRRNALGIDLNRDALHLTSPEARILKDERDRLDADWGFNLHDQGIYYSVGFPGVKGCVISILAPAFDWEKSMSEKREDAAQVIALMDRLWQEKVPGQIGRYNDAFEPRAFGDNLQKWGTRTILIESGGYPGDPEKQEIRKLNVLGLLAGLHGIATGGYEQYTLPDYLSIPENESNGMHALILENARIDRREGSFVMDIGFRLGERTLTPDTREFTSSAFISDLGDLSPFGAFERVDLEGMRVVPGKAFPEEVSADGLGRLDPEALYRRGYTAVNTRTTLPDPPPTDALRLLGPSGSLRQDLDTGAVVDLLIYDATDRLVMVVINGKLIRLTE